MPTDRTRVVAAGIAVLLLAIPSGVVRGAQGGSPASAGAARVGGVVFDSMTMRPLAEAVVQLALVPAAGTIASVRTTHTDSAGRYEFSAVPTGTYLLGFQHVAVDSLGLQSPVHRVDVRTTAMVSLAMFVPSMRSIIRTVCRRDGIKDSLAVMLGTVRHAEADTTLPGAFVSLRWGEVVLGRGGSMQRSIPIVDAFANAEGWFTACIPGDVPITVRAALGTDLSGSVELTVAPHAVLRRDLFVGPAEAEIRAPDSSVVERAASERIVERGRGVVRGVVRNLEGQPIAGARVAMLNGAGETRSNARGEYYLDGLPLGTHTLEARAIGFVPGQEVVDIVSFRRDPADFVLLDVSAYVLDTVRVAAVRRLEGSARAGFERRRRMGSGYFLDESVLDTIRAISFKDLVRRVPGIRFVRGHRIDDVWNEHVEFMSGQSQPCLPVIYVDGAQLVHDKTDLDQLLHPSVVRRVEVYYRGVAIPAEFASSQTCGVLAIWTGPRRR